VQNQFGYEEQFTDYENIYKVSTNNLNGNSGVSDALLISAGPPIGPTMVKDYEEVTTQARVVYMGGEFLMKPENSEKAFFQSEGYLVDSTFFDIFDVPLVEGNYKTALERPNSLILSAELSSKLFGNGNSPLGKQVQLTGNGDDVSMTVSGVFDLSNNKTHLQPNYLMSMGSTGMGSYVLTANEWNGNNFVHTYVKINPNTDPEALKAKFPAMLETYGAEQLKAANKTKVLDLIPITDVHLKTTEYEFPLSKNSDIKFVYMLLAIAFFIQLMACVNYINLTTAQATRRAKEIGVRKVNGAASKSLMYQFITESVVMSVLAVLLALPVILLLLPYINQLFNSAFVVTDVFSLLMLFSMLALGTVTGLLSGAYPAFYLAMIDPLKVMKKGFKSGDKTFSLRNGLVVFQFAMVFLLIYAVAVISQQLTHLSNSDKGFSENQKLVIPLKTTASQESYSTLKTQLEKMASVNAVTASEFYPSQNIWYDQKLYKQGETIDEGVVIHNNLARENFFETMGITLLEGRSISATDTSQMVVNETFLRQFNINIDEAVGTIMNRQPRGDGTLRDPYEIVGVIQDYNFQSLRDEVLPVATFYDNELSNMIEIIMPITQLNS
jgi:putative ABC transport system permease protein